MHLCSSIDQCPWLTIHRHSIDISLETWLKSWMILGQQLNHLFVDKVVGRVSPHSHVLINPMACLLSTDFWLTCQLTVRPKIEGDADIDVHEVLIECRSRVLIDTEPWMTSVHTILDLCCTHTLRAFISSWNSFSQWWVSFANILWSVTSDPNWNKKIHLFYKLP